MTENIAARRPTVDTVPTVPSSIDIDLAIEGKTITAIVGPSGVGKTTLLHPSPV